MKEFVPDHKKALMNASIQTATDQLDRLISTLITKHPQIAGALLMAKITIGFSLIHKQEELNQFIEFMKDNPHEFRMEIVESKEFQDGLILALEDYLKLRSGQKRKIAERIFLGFALSENREAFQLERFNEVLRTISFDALQLLNFLETIIIPIKVKNIKEQISKNNYSKSEKSPEWWFEQTMKTESISKYFQKWLHDTYNPNSPDIKKKYAVNGEIPRDKVAELFDIERSKHEEYYAPIAELEHLGLVSQGLEMASGFNGMQYMSWQLTKFAEEFIAYNLSST